MIENRKSVNQLIHKNTNRQTYRYCANCMMLKVMIILVMVTQT